jgi:outer membrane lipoprotein-sorting protein
MNNRRNEQEELLARATEALRAAHPDDGPPRELVASTIQRTRFLDFEPTPTTLEPDVVRLAERRKLMFRIARYSSATAAAILIAVFGWLFITDQGRPAFAGVIENVQQAQSVTLTNKQTIGKGPTMTMKWYIEGERIRMELPGAVAFVTNLGENTVHELNLRDKTATARPTPAGGRQAFANPVSHLQDAKPENAMQIGTEQLNGRPVELYRIDKIDFLGAKGNGEMKVWVDSETGLPVKILMDQPQKERGSRNTIELTDFEWNKDLDASLFVVPADFTVKEAQHPATGPGPGQR